MWSLIQWWASISFGLLVLANMAADRIGLYLTVLVSMLYTGFSFVVLQMAGRNMSIVESVFVDLRALKAAGNDLTLTAQYWMQGAEPATKKALSLIMLLTYIGVLGYFIYSYRNRQTDANT